MTTTADESCSHKVVLLDDNKSRASMINSGLPGSVRLVYWFALAVAAAIVVMAILGIARNYSPVPFWDMWDGYIGFYYRLRDGDLGAWLAQHNEHRIFLARLLFWLDLHWFAGKGAFLLVVSCCLAATTGLLFGRAIRWSLQGTTGAWIGPIATSLCIAMAFFWSQENNLTWAFQSQFLLAQLLPAAGLYCLARSSLTGPQSIRWFIVGAALGVIAAGSMANGVIALPVMVAFAVAAGLSWRRVIALSVLSALTIGSFFHGYQDIGHTRLSEVIQNAPLEAAKFVLMYLGSPVYFILLRARGAGVAAMLAGAAMLVIALVRLYQVWRERRHHPLDLAMLAFLIYIGVTACGTALGRVTGGLAEALSSRYTTPALMAWMATLVLVLPWASRRRINAIISAVVLLAVLCALVPYQRSALAPRGTMRFDRMLAASALALHVRDEQVVGKIFPFFDVALAIGDRAQADRLSVFAGEPLVGARQRIGTVEATKAPACEGHLESADVAARSGFALRVSGWARLSAKNALERIDIVDSTGKIVGLAIGGRPRQLGSGFMGYVVVQPAPGDLTFVATGSGCQWNARLPLALTSAAATPAAAAHLVSTSRIVGTNTFIGTDFFHSHFTGIDVSGSFQTSERDLGSIRLTLRRGDFLYYRTGPVPDRQTIAVPDLFDERPLPIAIEWQRLQFEDPRLPETFDVVITDRGSAWGEWSAIATAAASPANGQQ